MLDCKPSENKEHPLEMDSGSVSAEVCVLEREQVVTGGQVKTGSIQTESRNVSSGMSLQEKDVHDLDYLLLSLKCGILQALAFQEAALQDYTFVPVLNKLRVEAMNSFVSIT